jgi:outer membrane protein assembly factor BamE
MQKLFISLTCLAGLQVAACSSEPKDENAPTHSFLESIPIVYRPDIQQGNVVEQEQINQLKPGMTKRQVRFLLGTPMLVDVFHQERWDYVYTKTEGWGEMEERHIALYFEDGRLVRLEGDLRPEPGASGQPPEKETMVSVPDWEGSEDGIIGRAVKGVTSVWGEDRKAATPAATTEAAKESVDPGAETSAESPAP